MGTSSAWDLLTFFFLFLQVFARCLWTVNWFMLWILVAFVLCFLCIVNWLVHRLLYFIKKKDVYEKVSCTHVYNSTYGKNSWKKIRAIDWKTPSPQLYRLKKQPKISLYRVQKQLQSMGKIFIKKKNIQEKVSYIYRKKCTSSIPNYKTFFWHQVWPLVLFKNLCKISLLLLWLALLIKVL
jgi:hypothetical protein